MSSRWSHLMLCTTSFFLNFSQRASQLSVIFLKIASNGLPDGEDAQVGTGDSSHVDPDDLNQC